jgi:hypothetical protein
MVGGTARSISAAASGIIKKTAGRSWCYLDELESLDVSTRIPYTGKSVYCLELDKVFNTIKEAADELGLLERNIGQVCQGIHRTAGQMRFCYASEKDNINWEDKPIHISSGQLLMQTILTSMGVKFEVNNRSTLKNKRELDILIPEHKIAIEYNGVYWHQESTVGKDYHLMKTNEANELGLELIHVFEHQLTENNLSLWGSVIKNKCGLSGKGIMARKTKVVNISDKECKSFLDKNHLQGNSGSLVKLGLMYKDELVAVMTFGSPRFDKKYQWELIRFCCKQNTTVIGGASKLLKHFETQYAPKNLISYANLQWSNGNLYKNLGFKESHRSSPSYWWCKEKVAHTRHKCQKHKLATWLPNFNTEQTESENMKKNGYYKVYDCGNIVFTKSY